MTHEIKILKQFADEIINGNKSFEIRKNDRGYQKGDFIKFRVIEKHGNITLGIEHLLRDKLYEITYVLSGWGLKKDYVVLAIKERKEGD